MGSRGSKFEDGAKANKAVKKPPLSNVEKKIIAEGMDYPGLPDRGLARSRYQAEARKAKEILMKNKNKQIINDLPHDKPFSVRDIVEDKIPGLDGGFYLDEQAEKYLIEELGYASITDAINDLDNLIRPDDIYNMKYSDTFKSKIGGKIMEGQLYEFTTDFSGSGDGNTYLKFMNIHTKSGKTYSILLSVHEETPTENSNPIWEMANLKQPRYNQ